MEGEDKDGVVIDCAVGDEAIVVVAAAVVVAVVAVVVAITRTPPSETYSHISTTT